MTDTGLLDNYYTTCCHEMNVRPNSKILQQLKNNPRVIDISDNLVGPNGSIALATLVAKHMPDVQKINLSQNNLRAEHVSKILALLEKQEKLTHLDFSNNPISSLGGKDILTFVRRHHHIMDVNVAETRANAAQQRLIQEVLTARKQKAAAAVVPPVPTSSITPDSSIGDSLGLFMDVLLDDGKASSCLNLIRFTLTAMMSPRSVGSFRLNKVRLAQYAAEEQHRSESPNAPRGNTNP